MDYVIPEGALPITHPKDGKVLDRIISVFYVGQNLCHLIKWRGSDRCVVCYSDVINKKFPQVVIQFYQNKLFFID